MDNYKVAARIVSTVFNKVVSILEFDDGSQSVLIDGRLLGRVKGGINSTDTVKEAYYNLHHLCRDSLISRF